MVVETDGAMNQESGAPPARGPMWEHRGRLGFFPALVGTVTKVILAPRATFAAMRREGDLGGPLLFAVAIAAITTIVVTLYSVVLEGLGMRIPQLLIFSLPTSPAPLTFRLTVVALTPFLVAIGAFFWAGVYHVFLHVFGVAGASFNTTFRVHCYAMSASVFTVIPWCGTLLALLWWVALLIIGLWQAHGTTVAKALLSVLPSAACCVLCVAFPFGTLFPTGVGAGIAHYDGDYIRTRARLSRVQADMRCISVSIQAYTIDNDVFPAWTVDPENSVYGRMAEPGASLAGQPTFRIKTGPDDPLKTITTPVAYQGALHWDIFGPGGRLPYCYWSGAGNWLVWSAGPDLIYDLDVENVAKAFTPDNKPSDFLKWNTYDPSNGTFSRGDVWSIGE